MAACKASPSVRGRDKQEGNASKEKAGYQSLKNQAVSAIVWTDQRVDSGLPGAGEPELEAPLPTASNRTIGPIHCPVEVCIGRANHYGQAARGAAEKTRQRMFTNTNTLAHHTKSRQEVQSSAGDES